MIPGRDKLGKKHRCECGCKFYDFGKEEAACPRCGRIVKREKELESVSLQDIFYDVPDDDIQDVELVGEDEDRDVKVVSLSEVEEEEEDEELE